MSKKLNSYRRKVQPKEDYEPKKSSFLTNFCTQKHAYTKTFELTAFPQSIHIFSLASFFCFEKVGFSLSTFAGFSSEIYKKNFWSIGSSILIPELFEWSTYFLELPK